jgi:hypothetical protein
VVPSENPTASVLVNDPMLQIAEEVLGERLGDSGIADVDLDMVQVGLHQNFSHLTLFLSMPFCTRTFLTFWMVSPPPQT